MHSMVKLTKWSINIYTEQTKNSPGLRDQSYNDQNNSTCFAL